MAILWGGLFEIGKTLNIIWKHLWRWTNVHWKDNIVILSHCFSDQQRNLGNRQLTICALKLVRQNSPVSNRQRTNKEQSISMLAFGKENTRPALWLYLRTNWLEFFQVKKIFVNFSEKWNRNNLETLKGQMKVHLWTLIGGIWEALFCKILRKCIE